METKEFAKAVIFNFKDSVEYADLAIVSKIILKKETGNITLFAFDKGQALSEHTAPYDALVQVIDGKAGIIIDNKSYEIHESGSIILPAHVPHAVNAKERFKMILTMIRDISR
jgi:quercetin dioxygenase-like cupin family protein